MSTTRYFQVRPHDLRELPAAGVPEHENVIVVLAVDHNEVANQLAALKVVLATPEAVFVNLKRGTIAKPSLRSMLDLYGEVPNGEELLLELAQLRAEREEREAAKAPVGRPPAEPLARGEYVLGTKFADGDPRDPWAVGHYDGFIGGRHHVVDNHGNQLRPGGFRRAAPISAETGKWLLDNADRLEASGLDFPDGLWGLLATGTLPAS